MYYRRIVRNVLLSDHACQCNEMSRFNYRHAAVLAAVASLGAAGMAAARTAPAIAQSAQRLTTLLTSVTSINTQRHQAVFPLHRGVANGHTVWYILTDVSDAAEAKARGLVFAPALGGVGVTQSVTVVDGIWHFAGAPDFSSARAFRPGPTGFPPAAGAPGAKGDDAYSPFVRLPDSTTVYNAPIVAAGDAGFDVAAHTNTADRVLAIDPAAATVTLLLADGFADGKRVFYISTEASDPGAATIERATFVPSLAKSAASARLPIYVIANGQTGHANPQAQGLGFVSLDGGLAEDATTANGADLQSSRNILASAPNVTPSGNGTYTPLWDVYVGQWSAAATSAHRNVQLTSASAVGEAVAAHDLTGPDGKAFGPVGFAVNCPVVAIFN